MYLFGNTNLGCASQMYCTSSLYGFLASQKCVPQIVCCVVGHWQTCLMLRCEMCTAWPVFFNRTNENLADFQMRLYKLGQWKWNHHCILCHGIWFRPFHWSYSTIGCTWNLVFDGESKLKKIWWCIYIYNETRWWFQICFIFIPTWGDDPIWRAYFSNGKVPLTKQQSSRCVVASFGKLLFKTRTTGHRVTCQDQISCHITSWSTMLSMLGPPTRWFNLWPNLIP